jgi:MATE family multidrug resistance protein
MQISINPSTAATVVLVLVFDFELAALIAALIARPQAPARPADRAPPSKGPVASRALLTAQVDAHAAVNRDIMIRTASLIAAFLFHGAGRACR